MESFADYEEIINILMPFGQEMLAEHGGFLPYAAVIDSAGKKHLLAEHPHSKSNDAGELETGLVEEMRIGALEGRFRSVGWCSDVHLTRPDGAEVDAMKFCLETRSGEPKTYYLPYRIEKGGVVEFGELFVTAGGSAVFGAHPNLN